MRRLRHFFRVRQDYGTNAVDLLAGARPVGAVSGAFGTRLWQGEFTFDKPGTNVVVARVEFVVQPDQDLAFFACLELQARDSGRWTLNGQDLPARWPEVRYRALRAIPAAWLRPGRNVLTGTWTVAVLAREREGKVTLTPGSFKADLRLLGL